MSGSKKSKRMRRLQYRAPVGAQTIIAQVDTPEQVLPITEPEDEGDLPEQDERSTRPVAVAVPPAPESDLPPLEPPTIVLTPEQIALLGRAKPPQTSVPAGDSEGYMYHESVEPAAHDRYDSPTIILDIGALLAAPPPTVQAPIPPAPVRPAPEPLQLEISDTWQATASDTPTRKRLAISADPDERLAELHRLRTDLTAGVIQRLPEEPFISDKIRQWWHEIQPGIDRVLGRSHRAGTRGARATSYQTSAQMPAVLGRSLETTQAPALHKLSHTARQIGARAQTAAAPALNKMHSRAEKVAQQLVDRIDERLGGRPPMQHVLLGPGRMIVSFGATVTIRDAQSIIAAVQARALRRLIGYNAYLVLVPPGREARFAERLHAYRQVTGVHFGPQRPQPPAYPTNGELTS